GAIGGRGLENGDGEAVARMGRQHGCIRGGLVLAIRREGTERMVFGHGQPVIRDPVGADGRALHDMRDIAIGTETTESIGPGETEHIDHRVEALRLECTLERRPLTPVSPHEAGPRGDRAPQAAIDTGDRMALGQQHAHDTRTDMARSPNDTDVHRVAPPAAHYITRGPEVQYGALPEATQRSLPGLSRWRQPKTDSGSVGFQGVDVLRLSNLICVTFASLQPFFCHGLKKG